MVDFHNSFLSVFTSDCCHSYIAVNNAKASIDNYAAIKAVMDENDTKGITKIGFTLH